MKITDPIGDMITRIRNGQMRGLKKVSVPGSKLRKAVLDVLQKEVLFIYLIFTLSRFGIQYRGGVESASQTKCANFSSFISMPTKCLAKINFYTIRI